MRITLHRQDPDAAGRQRWTANFRGRKRHSYEVWKGLKQDFEGWPPCYCACRVLPDGFKTSWDLRGKTLAEIKAAIETDAQLYEEVA